MGGRLSRNPLNLILKLEYWIQAPIVSKGEITLHNISLGINKCGIRPLAGGTTQNLREIRTNRFRFSKQSGLNYFKNSLLGSWVEPMRNLSTPRAASRPSAMAHTTRD